MVLVYDLEPEKWQCCICLKYEVNKDGWCSYCYRFVFDPIVNEKEIN